VILASLHPLEVSVIYSADNAQVRFAASFGSPPKVYFFSAPINRAAATLVKPFFQGRKIHHQN
jgi:hypothetical protein